MFIVTGFSEVFYQVRGGDEAGCSTQMVKDLHTHVALVSCPRVSHAPGCHMPKCVTCPSVSHAQGCHSIRVSRAQVCHMPKGATCHMPKGVTAQRCHVPKCVTCPRVSHAQGCHMPKCVTCPGLTVVNTSPSAAALANSGWSVGGSGKGGEGRGNWGPQ